ncbi:serine/threonine-protein kinase STK11-like [Uloborus diversus]|uniref:serine/threonine-protein kinase STK11-like n=1 Tax=Uloborus diversus TaxID=327109 RepID=UPI00240A2E50|nr:serine/threonine-protein kinase STK11-like [Uloborus diversus]
MWTLQFKKFNITTGKYPFEGDSIYKLYENIGKGEVTIPEDLDKSLQELLSGMLQKDPNSRMTLNEAMDHCWVRRRPPVLAECVSIPKRSEKDVYRNMTVIPYLKALHGGEEEIESEDDEDIFYRVIPSTNYEPAAQAIESEPSASSKKHSRKKKRKAINCINVRTDFCKQS